MNNIKTALVLGFISLSLNAQKIIEKNIDYKNRTIDLDVKFASKIEVKTWDKATVYFKADINTMDGKFLDFYKLDVTEDANTISIRSEAEPIFKQFQKEWNDTHPDKNKRYYNTGDWYEFNYVLYVPKNAKFKVSSINGSLKSEHIDGKFTADLINGDIEIASYTGELDLTTINGAIDLVMRNTSVTAETINGEIYADAKLKFTAADRHVGQKISGSTENATNRLRLNTINGNMYLRL